MPPRTMASCTPRRRPTSGVAPSWLSARRKGSDLVDFMQVPAEQRGRAVRRVVSEAFDQLDDQFAMTAGLDLGERPAMAELPR